MIKIVLLLASWLAVGNAINPIVLVPGLGGSRFTMEVNETHDDHFYCSKHINHMELLWVNIEYFLPISINCFTERMHLEYNAATRKTSNKKGVNLFNPGWGQTKDLEYLGNLHISRTAYFYHIVDEMVSNHGYKRGISIRAAPYDFRKGPNELLVYLQRAKKLIEETYELNGRQKVILLAHSYGCVLMLQLLQGATQAWKDKYIRSYVSLEGPYYGSVVTVKMLLLGYSLNIPTVEASWLRPAQRSWPSSYALLPDERRWSKSEILVRAPHTNYTSNDYVKLFKDLDYIRGVDHYADTKQLLNPEIPPGVETFCIIGKGRQTDAWMDCSDEGDWPNSVGNCKQVFGDGDGTVPWRSLNMCQNWNNSQPNPFHLHVLPNADHFKVLSDQRFLDYFSKNIVGK